jgi:hypothetical protein
MVARTDQRISFKQAAALIYRASDPTSAQVRRVAELVALGEINGTARGTTMDDVAAYMAKATLDHRASAGAGRAPTALKKETAATHQEPLDRVYRETLKDYFLALIFRRKNSRASKSFQRAVLAGQFAILVMLIGAVLFTARTAFPPLAPERAAVVHWLRENNQQFRIIQWHPAVRGEDGKMRMRVEYHYVTDRRKGIDTDRIFTIHE